MLAAHEFLQELTDIAARPLVTETAIQSSLSAMCRFAGWQAGRLVVPQGIAVNGQAVFVWPPEGQERPPTFPDAPFQANLRVGEALVVEDIGATDRQKHPGVDTPSAFKGYVAYPVTIEAIAPAVLEFYCASPMRLDPTLEAALAHVAMLLGLLLERERHDRQIRGYDRRFRALFEHPYSFTLLLEPDGTLIEVSELALRLGGVRAEDVVGKKIWDKAWWKVGDSEQEVLREVIRRAASGERHQFDIDVQEPDGQRTHYENTIQPVYGDEGEVKGVLIGGLDVSVLSQSMTDLRKTQAALEEAQRIAQLGNWEYNLSDNRAVWSNMLFSILGLDPATTQASDQELLNRIHPDDVEKVRTTLARSIEKRRPYEVQFRIIRPNGAVRVVYGAGGPKMNQNNEVVSLTGIIQDISGRHELERSLATVIERLSGLNSMGQAVVSSLDAGAIYRYVLTTARALLQADDIILFLHEGEELYVAALDEKKSTPFVGFRMPEHTGIAGEVWASGRAIWVSGELARTKRLPQLHEMLGYEPGTILAVPVIYQNEFMGVLEAADVREDAFTLDEVRTLEAVATWTAIAIGNANQHRELQRRLKENEAIADISREMSGTLEPQAILELIAQTAHEIVPSSDWAVVHLVRGRPERLEPAAVVGTDTDLSHYIIEPGEGIAGHVLLEGRVINAGDMKNDPRASRFAREFGMNSLLVAPIKSRHRELGTISLHSMASAAFSAEDERLLSILATQAAFAIENAQLFDSQRRARLVAEMQRERLRVLTDRLVSSQEDERMRISRELHDEAGQALTSLKISLDLARIRLTSEQSELRQTLLDLGSLAGQTMDTLRTLAHDLRPPGLDAFGLNVALDALCSDFAKRTDLTVQYEGVELPGLQTAVALSIYRLVQEALTNIAKHAEAQTVAVNLSYLEDGLHLIIRDDGRGFSLDSNGQQSKGIGLVSMQERTDLLGGKLEIDTAPGSGTQLTVYIPVGMFTEDSGSQALRELQE